jgi:hypothetical protein
VSGDRTGPVIAQANVQAPPGTGQIGRVNTQWTGNLSIPEGEAPPAKKSRLPLIVGAIVLVGGAAAAAAVVVSRTGGSSGSGSAAGSQAIAAASPTPSPSPSGSAAPVATPAPATPPAAQALAFERTQIRLDSAPSHTEVRDLASGKLLGQTPFSFTLPSSRTARQFVLHRKGYVDAVVEIVPDREKIEYTEKLEKGAATQPAVVHQATDPATRPPPARPEPPGLKPDPARPESPATRPEPAAIKPEPPVLKPEPPALKPEPPTTKPDPVPPATPDPDMIKLKPDPSRLGSGSGSP